MKRPKLAIVMVEEVDPRATGERFRQYRESLGVSLREVARRMEVSAPYLSDLELGRRQWNIITLERACLAAEAGEKGER